MSTITQGPSKVQAPKSKVLTEDEALERDGFRVVIIKTRRGSGDCYVARAEGKTASCTSSPHQAAEGVALKIALGRTKLNYLDTVTRYGILLRCVAEGTYRATWKPLDVVRRYKGGK